LLFLCDERRQFSRSPWVTTFEACSVHPISGPDQLLARWKN